MKKLFAILTVLAVLLSAVAFAETVDVTGEWFMTEMVMGETSINPAAMGMSMSLTLNEDGTVIATNDNGQDEPDVKNGTWELSDEGVILSIDETPDTLILEDGQLKIVEDEGTIVFGREAAEAPALPVAVAAESEDAFLGVWKLTQIGMAGILLPAEAMEGETLLTVEAGKATLVSGEEADEYATSFADGVLTLTSAEEGEEPMILELNDNGSVSSPIMLGEEVFMTMYFEKAE